MKKIPILFLSILTINIITGLISPPKTSALYKDDSGATWWTVEELLEFSKVKEAEEEAICGDNSDCIQELFFSHFEDEDGRYRALATLEESQFWVTSINPGQETMEVLYFDEEPFLKMMGIKDPHPLDYVFIAWFNKINGAIGNYNHELPIESQFPDDLHLLYANDSASFSKTGFPSNQPFILPINKTNLEENISGRLDIATFGEYYNSKGTVNYSSCLREPDYSEGLECKLMFSAERGFKYFPPRNTIISNNENEPNIGDNNNSNGPNITNEENTENIANSSNLEYTSTTSSEANTDGQVSTREDLSNNKEKTQIANKHSLSQKNNLTHKANPLSLRKNMTAEDLYIPKREQNQTAIISNESSTRNIAPLSSDRNITLPKTGKLESGCRRVVEFPWWLIILMILGDIIVLWFFWPKKSEKTLDKGKKVR